MMMAATQPFTPKKMGCEPYRLERPQEVVDSDGDDQGKYIYC